MSKKKDLQMQHRDQLRKPKYSDLGYYRGADVNRDIQTAFQAGMRYMHDRNLQIFAPYQWGMFSLDYMFAQLRAIGRAGTPASIRQYLKDDMDGGESLNSALRYMRDCARLVGWEDQREIVEDYEQDVNRWLDVIGNILSDNCASFRALAERELETDDAAHTRMNKALQRAGGASSGVREWRRWIYNEWVMLEKDYSSDQPTHGQILKMLIELIADWNKDKGRYILKDDKQTPRYEKALESLVKGIRNPADYRDKLFRQVSE